MGITNILSLLGGLALFLYGMQMMSSGLEDAAGNRMKKILERLTSNRLLGVAVGAIITAVIQSSSATTVMVVGFVNSGMMTLRQAVWIIMGANIGTTITGQLIALDVGMLAPLFAFVGVALVVFFKAPKAHHIGKIRLFLDVSVFRGRVCILVRVTKIITATQTGGCYYFLRKQMEIRIIKCEKIISDFHGIHLNLVMNNLPWNNQALRQTSLT